jgi:predicted DNA-binding ribbon-helix-helix protein
MMQNLSQNWKRAITAVRDFRALMSRNIRLPFHRTSFRPDPLTWSALQEIARREKVSVHELCAAIDTVKPRGVSRTAAIRVAVLRPNGIRRRFKAAPIPRCDRWAASCRLVSRRRHSR